MENNASRCDSNLGTARQANSCASRINGRVRALGLGIGLLALSTATMPLRAADQASAAAPDAVTSERAETEAFPTIVITGSRISRRDYNCLLYTSPSPRD